MLASARVIGFIPTKDFRRARAFYGATLGLRLVSKDSFALVFKSGTTTLRVVKVDRYKPSAFTIIGWEVADILKAVKALGKRGVVFERYPWMEQDASGIWISPEGASVAWFKDLDGNVLSVSSRGDK